MRKAVIIGLMAMAGLRAEEQSYRVTVYVQDQQVADPLLLARAEALATSVYAGIGVRLRWEVGAPRPARGRKALPDAEIVIRFASKTPVGFRPGAPAYALPYNPESDVRITILYDRVLAPVVGNRNEGAVFLGHILAHEIGHVLQGVARHSEEGVMKAQWMPEDRMQMRIGPLSFTDHDVELIRLSMANRHDAVRMAGR